MDQVTCPICGIHGQLSIVNDGIQVEFTKEQQERARGTFKGLREHTLEIQGFGSICGPKIMANKEKIDSLMNNRIKNFETAIEA